MLPAARLAPMKEIEPQSRSRPYCSPRALQNCSVMPSVSGTMLVMDMVAKTATARMAQKLSVCR